MPRHYHSAGRALRLALLAAAASLAGCAGGAGQLFAPVCRLIMVDDVPLVPIANDTALVVPANIGGTILPIMLDTGAQSSVIARAAIPVAPEIIGQTTITGVGGKRSFGLAKIPRFNIGSLTDPVPVLISDDPWYMSGTKSGNVVRVPAAGLLGMEWISRFDIDLDIPANRLRLFATMGDCQAIHVALAPPDYAVPEIGDPKYTHPPRIHVMIGDTLFVALIDTGSQSTAIFRNDAARLGLAADALAHDTPGHAAGISGVIAMHAHMVPALRIGDLTLDNVPMHVLDQDSDDGVGIILGMDFIHRVHLWLSQSSHTVVMQFPPRPSPKVQGE